jgi:hypothetical protein
MKSIYFTAAMISTDLVELISYAGGPIQYADLDKVKIIRMADIAETPRLEFYVDLNNAKEMIPDKLKLRDGDTIFIDHTSWVTMRDVFTVVTTTALVTAAISQVIYATRR